MPDLVKYVETPAAHPIPPPTSGRRPVLAAINARYSHPSLGARYLLAALRADGQDAVLREFTVRDTAAAIVTDLLAETPSLIGLGVYIWNRDLAEGVVAGLQTARPDIPIVLGGPEIGHDTGSALARSVACVIRGEGERTFPTVCRRLSAGEPVPSVVDAERPDVRALALPYDAYSDTDILRRTMYVESSRGCPFACDYCISARDPGVRDLDLDRLLPALDTLLERGARRFKLVDRSFNAHPAHACRLLDFFLARLPPGLHLHLEMTPQPPVGALRERLCAFPPGALHIEVGIQTFNPEVARRVHRMADAAEAEAAVRFHIETARADVHADLIAGLPGESPASFEAGFDRLVRLRPAELQVGILKRLHGAPIARHVEAWQLRFRPTPPYDILSTSTMDADYLAGIRRFARHWERLANRRRFPRAMAMLLEGTPSPFRAFDDLSRRIADDAAAETLDPVALARALHRHLVARGTAAEPVVRRALREDYLGGHARHEPAFLREGA